MKLKDIIKTGIVVGSLTIAGLSSGCSSTSTFDWQTYARDFSTRDFPRQVTRAESRSPAIYCFNGWGEYQMHRIVNPLIKKVNVSDCEGIPWGKWPTVMDRIKQQALLGHPIILLGHSAGGSEVTEVANVLEKVNVPVGMIMLDSTYLGSNMFKPGVKGIPNSNLIPSNVYHVENYVTNGPFGGRNLRPSDFKDPSKTTYNNYFIDVGHLDLLKKEYSDTYVRSINKLLEGYERRR